MRKLLLLFVACMSLTKLSAYDMSLNIEKFAGIYHAGDSLPVVDSKNEIDSTSWAVVCVDPKKKSNLCLHVYTSKAGRYVRIPVREEYHDFGYKINSISLKVYREPGTEKSRLYVGFGASQVYYDKFGTVQDGKTGAWYTKSVKLSAERSMPEYIRLAFSGAGAEYYIDDISMGYFSYNYDYDDPTQTARYWADQIGKDIGVCVNPYMGNDRFAQTVYKNFNMVVLENGMKMDVTEPNRNQFNFSAGDNVYSFAKSHGMKVRGHTLCWHAQVPRWIASDGATGENDKGWTKAQLLDILKNHVIGVAKHFRGKVTQWDVVNECLADGNHPTGGYSLRTNSIWYQVIGEAFIDSAFVWAHSADPDAELYLNDYNAGPWEGHWSSGKTQALYNLAKRLKDSGIPIDGIGLQTHTGAGDVSQLAQIRRTFQKCEEAGLKCIITEMDITQDATGESNQGKFFEGLADIICSQENAPSIVAWGVDDNHSWIDGSETSKPLFFNADLSAKSGYNKTVQVFKKYAIQTSVSSPEMERISFDKESVQVVGIDGIVIATDMPVEQVRSLPRGLYIVDGKKIFVE